MPEYISPNGASGRALERRGSLGGPIGFSGILGATEARIENWEWARQCTVVRQGCRGWLVRGERKKQNEQKQQAGQRVT
jgi:hypothetical protein